MTTVPTDRQTKQILIVEDDEDSRRALLNVLEDKGYSVAALDSCEAALDYDELLRAVERYATRPEGRRQGPKAKHGERSQASDRSFHGRK